MQWKQLRRRQLEGDKWNQIRGDNVLERKGRSRGKEPRWIGVWAMSRYLGVGEFTSRTLNAIDKVGGGECESQSNIE